jgi:DEAD/DEAH box helicase
MTQVRHFLASVLNCVTGSDGKGKYVTSSSLAAEKMGHSVSTHSTKYSSERTGDESYFNSYHSALGETSFQVISDPNELSLFHIREAVQHRYPTSNAGDSAYLSMQQEELVEFGYGFSSQQEKKHCLGLMAPGEGKSECYIIPTIARHYANKKNKMIIHVSPYMFLAGYQHAKAVAVFEELLLPPNISSCFFTGRDIKEGHFPQQLTDKAFLPGILFLNLDGMYNLFTYFFEELRSWVPFMDKIVLDEVHTILSELSFRSTYKVYFRLPACPSGPNHFLERVPSWVHCFKICTTTVSFRYQQQL